jgi:hypothetical protein
MLFKDSLAQKDLEYQILEEKEQHKRSYKILKLNYTQLEVELARANKHAKIRQFLISCKSLTMHLRY